MKKLLLLSHLLINFLIARTQDEPAKAPVANANAYAKGNWRMPLMQNLRSGFYDNTKNDTKISDENNLELNIETQYFFAGNWALGLDVGLSADNTKYPGGNENINNEWSASMNLLYGRSVVGNKLYWNASIGYGFGQKTDKEKISANTTKERTDYSKFSIITGLDIRSGNSNVFINPFIGYDIYDREYENNDEEDFSTLRFGVRLVSAMACREYSCDMKTKCALSQKMYSKGRSFIGYTTDGMFAFGGYDVYETNSQGNHKGNYNEGHVLLDYNYYIIDYLALGVSGMYGYEKDEGKDFDFKSTSHSFLIGPKLTAHIPVNNCWRNFFGELGTAFGDKKNEIRSGSSASETKYSLTNIWGGIGYNVVLSPNLSFTPIANYISSSRKDSDTDDEYKKKGLDFRFGIRYLF